MKSSFLVKHVSFSPDYAFICVYKCLDFISLRLWDLRTGGLRGFGGVACCVQDPGEVSGHSLYPSLVPSLLLVA